MEMKLLSVYIGREKILNTYLEMIRDFYDFIIIDCKPSLDISKSQLQELLAINDQKLIEQITPDMSVKKIKEIKKSHKAEVSEKESSIHQSLPEVLPGQMHMVLDGSFREFETDKNEIRNEKFLNKSI